MFDGNTWRSTSAGDGRVGIEACLMIYPTAYSDAVELRWVAFDTELKVRLLF